MQYGVFFYSLDKIKLKGKLSKTHTWWNRVNISYWVQFALPEYIECIYEAETLKPFKYRYCYALRIKGETEGTFTVFEFYNGDFKETTQRPEYFQIEYNPNKTGERIYKAFCDTFVFSLTDVKSFDIAYDIEGYSPNDVRIDTICDVMTYGKLNNYTTYIAPKENGSGRVKIYAKDVERKQKGIETKKKLRIEVSCNNLAVDYNTIYLNDDLLQQMERICNRLNSVKIRKKTPLDVTDWQLYALLNLPKEEQKTALNLMSKNTRNKYKNLIQEVAYFTLDIDVIRLCEHITKLLKPYVERIKVK